MIFSENSLATTMIIVRLYDVRLLFPKYYNIDEILHIHSRKVLEFQAKA